MAEEVEKVNPALVVDDADGKPYSIRYEAVNAMLLNEFLKEHRKVEEQDRTVQEQKAAITQLKSASTNRMRRSPSSRRKLRPSPQALKNKHPKSRM